MVAREVRGATSADVLEERNRRHALRSEMRSNSDAMSECNVVNIIKIIPHLPKLSQAVRCTVVRVTSQISNRSKSDTFLYVRYVTDLRLCYC